MQNRLTGPTNELAKERNRAAAERTMTAWIQNCLGLIGFGFAVDQIFSALSKRSNEPTDIFPAEMADSVGRLFIVLGIVLLIIAMVQYYLEVSSIKRANYFFLPSTPLNSVVVFAVILFGLLGIWMVLLQSEMFA